MDSRVRVFAKRRRHRGLRRRRSKQHNSDHSDDDSTASDTWYHQEANNRSVDNITIKFFYKPRTLTLLFVCLVAMVSFAFARNEKNVDNNIIHGLLFVVFMFEVVCVLTFPNGPFTRPHPVIWRMVLGFGVLYLMLLAFALFQRFSDIDRFLRWLDPSLIGQGPDLTNYAADCSFTFANVWTRIDIFVIGHLLGWTMKAVVIRDMVLCWANSIVWEVTEVAFAHLLMNFNECWWDIWLLDIIFCNGLGIFLGIYLCKKLEMREFNWASIKDLKRPRDKIRRAVLQFTPESWTHVRWLDPQSTYMRYIAIALFVIIWQVSELNTFFLKHIFLIPTHNSLNTYRLILVGALAAPAIRQYYVYVTDKTSKRMGTHAWVFLVIMFAESIVCVKFGLELFAQTIVSQVAYWIAFQLMVALVCVYLVVVIDKRRKSQRRQSANTEVHNGTVSSAKEDYQSELIESDENEATKE